MGLIKSENAPATMAAFSMRDIEAQAQTILLRARQQADQLLAAAQTEAEQLKASAMAQGMAEGRQTGLEQGRREGTETGKREALSAHGQELRNTLAALTIAASVLESGRAELEVAALHEVVELAAAIARRVTKRQGRIDPLVLSGNLTDALKLVVHGADIRIAIHPSQRKTLSELLPLLAVDWPDLKHVEVIEDEEIAPGGCRVFTRQGQVDANLGIQLDRVVAELMPA